MKNLKITTLIFLFATLLFASCKQDKCDDINCLNDATCDDGTCICITGYEGQNCETEQRTKFVGIYNGTANCDGDQDALQVSINNGTTAVTSILIDFDDDFVVQANVSGTTLTIPTQIIEDSSISGSGSIIGDNLTINMDLLDLDDNETYNCVINLTM